MHWGRKYLNWHTPFVYLSQWKWHSGNPGPQTCVLDFLTRTLDTYCAYFVLWASFCVLAIGKRCPDHIGPKFVFLMAGWTFVQSCPKHESMVSQNTRQKAVTGLDRESAHPLQLNTRKGSCCTAANPGVTERLSPCVGMIMFLLVTPTTDFFQTQNRLPCPHKGINNQ